MIRLRCLPSHRTHLPLAIAGIIGLSFVACDATASRRSHEQATPLRVDNNAVAVAPSNKEVPAAAIEAPSAAPPAIADTQPVTAAASDLPTVTDAVLPASPSARLEDERNTIDVFRAIAPAVVHVTQNRTYRSPWSAPETVEAGTGTGFVWDKNGHIVTNAHVVSDSDRRIVAGNATFEVTTFDGSKYAAHLVGVATEKDLAVLKIEAQTSSLVPIRRPTVSQKLQVGQKTLAIGNPFGLDHTLTTGIISALDREVTGFGGLTIRNMIQTDASINPGNSGGPLLNSAGELIGINTMIYSNSGSSAGIGFAVPIETIHRFVPELIEFGEPRRVGFGILPFRDSIVRRAGIRGVVIERVVTGSPAAKAGLRTAKIDRRSGQASLDIIIAVDKRRIESYDDLYNALEPHRPGDVVDVVVERDGRSIALKIPVQAIEPGLS